MNFDAFWQQHRHFITGVILGLIVFLIGRAFVGSHSRSEFLRAQQQIRSYNGKLRTSAYSVQQVQSLESHLSELESRTSSLKAVTLPNLRDDFQPRPGQSSSQHYIQWTGKLRQELLAFALRNNVDVEEDLGLPPQQPAQPDQLERVMRGLDVVDRVCRMAVLAGAMRVEDIEIQVRQRRTRGRRSEEQILALIPVSMEVIFPIQSSLSFLDDILQEGDGLGPLGLTKLVLQEPHERKRERRVLLEFSVGSLPKEEVEE
jgi:hypothetical protein